MDDHRKYRRCHPDYEIVFGCDQGCDLRVVLPTNVVREAFVL